MTQDPGRCMVFASVEAVKDEQLKVLLGQLAISVTVCTAEQNCFNQLDLDGWDLLIADAADNGKEARSLLSQCKKMIPETAVLAMVPRGDIRTTVRAMKAGATDCIDLVALSHFSYQLTKATGRGYSVPLLEHYLPLVQRIIDQADRRINRSETVSPDEKLYSLFESHTELIVRGKASNPTFSSSKLLYQRLRYLSVQAHIPLFRQGVPRSPAEI